MALFKGVKKKAPEVEKRKPGRPPKRIEVPVPDALVDEINALKRVKRGESETSFNDEARAIVVAHEQADTGGSSSSNVEAMPLQDVARPELVEETLQDKGAAMLCRASFAGFAGTRCLTALTGCVAKQAGSNAVEQGVSINGSSSAPGRRNWGVAASA